MAEQLCLHSLLTGLNFLNISLSGPLQSLPGFPLSSTFSYFVLLLYYYGIICRISYQSNLLKARLSMQLCRYFFNELENYLCEC